MIEINPARLLATLEALRNIGRCGTGVHRPALTPADLEGRLWLRECLVKLGFDARLDRFGTVLGRAPGDAPAILIGSHTDTVPQGGWLDGALGVAYALEIATARVEALGAPAARVDVVSFQDEEGTFVPLLGSRAFIGEITAAESFADAEAIDGRRLGDALAVELIRARPGAGVGAPRRAPVPAPRPPPHARVPRSAYRAGPSAGGAKPSSRHRHGDRRHPPIPCCH